MTSLDELIEQIDPGNTFDKVSSRAHSALNTFHMNSSVVDDWDEFKSLMSHIFCHVENGILGGVGPRAMNPVFDWERCVKTLNTIYGPEGQKAAFEIARTGNEGSLRAVIKALTDKMAESYARAEISARVARFIEELRSDIERYKRTVAEYLKEYSHLLPSDITEGTAVRVAFEFQTVLEKHPVMVRELRKVGR